ncbi:AAA family ATPase [Mucilaginibacter boryungensis]|uniref:AAA family ATPase n=1 Tax=Mucilaginibacter boryungensis TaxID=768480 RepID=A0ABR9XK63_9SPHI|nr:AAA family ATPase [Mucilaginibacter boryungensis]MBE9667776.1 AAA family ATPase [Mucilaginibacter boryungensis]
MKLKQLVIHKYKCIETEQQFDIEDDITILVGMNESGKTSVLEALAKSNYFVDDKKFKFTPTHDYPRKEKKSLDKSGDDPKAITATYSISEDILKAISADVGDGIFTQKSLIINYKFSNSRTYNNISCDSKKFIENKTSSLGISSKTLNDKLYLVKNTKNLEALIAEYKDENLTKGIATLKKYFENKWNWAQDPIGEYISRVHLSKNLPKFLYYDEYYALPSRISIENLQNDELDDEELKTAKALFDLADINVNELINSDNYEDFKAELEATQATITNELFKYWGSNNNLEIIFDIDKREQEVERTTRNAYGQTETIKDVKVVEHILDIRVKNRRSGVSLPLKNRSKGFNWFFSFLVWFKKIQEDNSNNYILLLDEPGLNLHASAQNNLLRFLKDLSENYQIIYTTHSPFMIESHNLEKVRTVLETEKGSIISNSIQEKDPNTLFPLQAALGYDIAQNLFISKHNLLVEGASDLLYLQVMSSLLQSLGRTGLNEKITIVPTGGLDKVSTFISLLRGSDLSIVCLLDTFKDAKGKSKLDDLVEHRIINKKKIRFFDEFLEDYTSADIEDLFEKNDYLKFYNEAFSSAITIDQLNDKIKPILVQISKFLNITTFNHYRPANKLASKGVDEKFFSSVTLKNFEKVFTEINDLFNEK